MSSTATKAKKCRDGITALIDDVLEVMVQHGSLIRLQVNNTTTINPPLDLYLCPVTMRVSHLKRILSKKLGIPPEEQRLYYYMKLPTASTEDDEDASEESVVSPAAAIPACNSTVSAATKTTTEGNGLQKVYLLDNFPVNRTQIEVSVEKHVCSSPSFGPFLSAMGYTNWEENDQIMNRLVQKPSRITCYHNERLVFASADDINKLRGRYAGTFLCSICQRIKTRDPIYCCLHTLNDRPKSPSCRMWLCWDCCLIPSPPSHGAILHNYTSVFDGHAFPVGDYFAPKGDEGDERVRETTSTSKDPYHELENFVVNGRGRCVLSELLRSTHRSLPWAAQRKKIRVDVQVPMHPFLPCEVTPTRQGNANLSSHRVISFTSESYLLPSGISVKFQVGYTLRWLIQEMGHDSINPVYHKCFPKGCTLKELLDFKEESIMRMLYSPQVWRRLEEFYSSRSTGKLMSKIELVDFNLNTLVLKVSTFWRADGPRRPFLNAFR